MPVFSTNGIGAQQLQVRTNWPAAGSISTVDLQRSAVRVIIGASLTPVDFAAHAGIFSTGMSFCSSMTYLMGPGGGRVVYTNGAMSHIPSSVPGPFCNPTAALATVPVGGVVILDVVVSVHDRPTAQTIVNLQNFLTRNGIPAAHIWVYDGEGDAGIFGVRRDGRAGNPYNYEAPVQARAQARDESCTII